MFSVMNLISTPYTKIMTQLARDPMKVYYQRELSRICKVSVGATNLALRELVQLEFVIHEKRGRMYFYKLNLKNPVAKQFKILLNVDDLYSSIREVSKDSVRVILFGSSAEGTDIRESDIDLLILTNEKERVRRQISNFNSKSERRIAPIIVDANEFVKLRREDKPLYERLERGITLWERE